MDLSRITLAIFFLCFALLLPPRNAYGRTKKDKEINEGEDEITSEKEMRRHRKIRMTATVRKIRSLPKRKRRTRMVAENGKLTLSSAQSCKTKFCVRRILGKYNHSCTLHMNRKTLAYWKYATNINKETEAAAARAKFEKKTWKNRMKQIFHVLNQETIKGLCKEDKRELRLLDLSASTNNENDLRRLTELQTKLASTFSKGKVVFNGKEMYAASVSEFFRKSRNCTALADIWKQWRNNTGKKMRTQFEEMVTLLNKGARQNNYPDYGYYEQMAGFEQGDFSKKAKELYDKLAPFYKELHAYIRFKLSKAYPDCVTCNSPIPAHLLGNVWAEQFGNINDLLKPYPNVNTPDITKALINKNWTVIKMFKSADNFFSSLGLFNMTEKFWKYSMFTKPKDKMVACHSFASDLFSDGDFRIRMCARVNNDDYVMIYHEMGHIIYFMAYEKQRCTFRAGANTGILESVGDSVGLSARSISHLRTLHLLDNFKESEEDNINTLMFRALDEVAFIPFSLLVDTWRWGVFNGTISPSHYNSEWWRLREELQGLQPPMERTEDDFDPGAKYHIPNNAPYIIYFFCFIAKFQFYEAMCDASGYKGPLFKCNFYGSKKAGALLKSMLSLGASKPWPEAMKLMTGQPDIKVDSFIRYFKPLFAWLKKHRCKEKYEVGW